jgi:glycosyltransferase involved in cell wall biosynthesis
MVPVTEFPLITVGIPFFNAANTLELAAASILAQTYPNLELILMDDGSTDQSLEAAKRASASWAMKRGASTVRIVSDGRNHGLPYRLNQINSLARGEFIARMDADDLSHPARLERQFKALTETGCDVVSTSTIYIDGRRQPMGKLDLGEKPFAPEPFVMFKNGSHLVHASILAKASWCRANPYRADFNRAEDRELFCRTIKKSRYLVLPELLYFYYLTPHFNFNKFARSYRLERTVLRIHGPSAIGLLEMGFLFFRSLAKSLVLHTLRFLRQERLIAERISRIAPLSGQELLAYDKAMRRLLL